jgi:outer membrane protein OmpA-like peptidoglycan-associated protein
VAEIDYRYFKGTDYLNQKRDEAVIHVGLLMYFGSKKKPIFQTDTASRHFSDIRFFPNDATIVESWMPLIDTLATYLKENERKSVMLCGYSDNQGTAAYCEGLSRQRATEVKKALLMRGIEKERIEVEVKGDADPIGDNSTREGRIKNNRVAIKIL